MQAQNDILTRLCAILRRHARKPVTIGEDTMLAADLDLDSAQLMDMVLEIEEEFDISVPLNILPDVQTVRDLARQLEPLIREKS